MSELISQVRHQWRNRRIWSWKDKQRDVQFAITSHIRKIHIVQGHSSLSRFTSSLIANYSLIHMQIVVQSFSGIYWQRDKSWDKISDQFAIVDTFRRNYRRLQGVTQYCQLYLHLHIIGIAPNFLGLRTTTTG